MVQNAQGQQERAPQTVLGSLWWLNWDVKEQLYHVRYLYFRYRYVFFYHISSKERNLWEKPSWKTPHPPVRYLHASYVTTSKMLVVGGMEIHDTSSSECFSIKLGLEYIALEYLPFPGLSPLSSHTLSCIGDQCFVFGGYLDENRSSNELWHLEFGLPPIKQVQIQAERGHISWKDSSDLINCHSYQLLIQPENDSRGLKVVYEGNARLWKMTGLVNGVSYLAEVYVSNSIGKTKFPCPCTFQYLGIGLAIITNL